MAIKNLCFIKRFLGIEFEDKDCSKTIQFLWIFIVPLLIGFLVLGGSSAPIWISRPVFAVQIATMFFNGKENPPWAKRWLCYIGIYFLVICGGSWVLETLRWGEKIPLVPLLAILATAIPCIFPLCVTKEIIGFPAKKILIFPSVLIVWLCFSLAYFCGRMVKNTIRR